MPTRPGNPGDRAKLQQQMREIQQQPPPPIDLLKFYGGLANYASWMDQGGYPAGVAGPPPWISTYPPPSRLPQPYHAPPGGYPMQAVTRG